MVRPDRNSRNFGPLDQNFRDTPNGGGIELMEYVYLLSVVALCLWTDAVSAANVARDDPQVEGK